LVVSLLTNLFDTPGSETIMATSHKSLTFQGVWMGLVCNWLQRAKACSDCYPIRYWL